jgi:hypothetical protein
MIRCECPLTLFHKNKFKVDVPFRLTTFCFIIALAHPRSQSHQHEFGSIKAGGDSRGGKNRAAQG